MSENNDIFPPMNQRGLFVSFKEIGDSVKGTYVARSENVNQYGNAQHLITLEQADGTQKIVPISKTNTIMMEDVDSRLLGEIIGFRLEAIIPSKRVPGKMAKIIKVHPEIMDQKTRLPKVGVERPFNSEWLASVGRSEPFMAEVGSISAAPSNTPVPTTAPSGAKAVTSGAPAVKASALDAVRNLAASVGLNTDEEIENFANMKMVDANAMDIMVKLTQLK